MVWSINVRLSHMKLLIIGPFGPTKTLISCGSTYSFVARWAWEYDEPDSIVLSLTRPEADGKNAPLCCTARSGIVDQKPVARGQGYQWRRIMTWFFSALAAANFTWAPVLRGSHLGTHSLCGPPSGSYLNPFNFLTCTWVIYMYEDLKPSLFAK